MKDLLPSALSNAALLIAAPSLGCLRTYTRTLTDLFRAYSLPEPDLSHVLHYGRATSLSPVTTMATEITSNEYQKSDKIEIEYDLPANTQTYRALEPHENNPAMLSYGTGYSPSTNQQPSPSHLTRDTLQIAIHIHIPNKDFYQLIT